jgi:hypothetical protein
MKITTAYGAIAVESAIGGSSIILSEPISGARIVLLPDEVDELFAAINQCRAEYLQRMAEAHDRRRLEAWNSAADRRDAVAVVV